MINAGFFIMSPKVIDLIENDQMPWESTPLQSLAQQKQLSVWKHHGFWQPMDTLREKNHLEDLWLTGKAPWKTW
jgi:glucose-1-phosphate cytidylyltransferase